jgi:5'-3' exonuclease
MEQKQSVLLVDGMALLFRGFFATSYRGQFMLTPNGVPTNGIFGFTKYLLDAIEQFQPSHIVCCWDMGSKTFRNELYNSYKGNRSEPPVELIPQFDLVKDVTSSLGIVNVGIEGYEADDVIGTLARQFSEHIHVNILTGDHDSLQLIDDAVHVIIMKKGMSNYAVYTRDMLRDEKGLTPTQIIDLKGLMGDASDNYPGVNGIGEKTALKLLLEYESIDNLLLNINSLSKGIQKKIESDKEMLHLSKRLATIFCEVPVFCKLGECKWELDLPNTLQKLEKIESTQLTSLIKKVKIPLTN